MRVVHYRNSLPCAGDELAQVVGCPWRMRDSGGSLAQNRWQGDLGLTAVGQDDTGGGRHATSAGWRYITFDHIQMHYQMVVQRIIKPASRMG